MSSFEKNNNLTIINLFYFFKNEENLYNENIINNFIKQLDDNNFWLGGQIKLSRDDFINLETIERVKEIIKQRFIDYGPPCNSIEMMSMNASTKQLKFIEDMIITYNKLNK
jgi:predicted ferric reductase